MNKNAKLNQIIAIEKGVKSQSYSVITELHKLSQKHDLFSGFSKTYKSKDDEGEGFPPEKKNVQARVESFVDAVTVALTELYNVTATKDYANCSAVADVVVDGQVIIEKAPATFLLFIEKQVNDIKTFVEKLPLLDEAEDWTKDINSGLYKTESIQTHKTKKVQKPVVLYEATDKHPAQTQLLTEDIIIGYWDTIKLSGALPLPEKKKILERIDKFGKAVKFAREEANSIECDRKQVGEKIFNYIFAD
jgi:hypothetical protein